MRQHSYWVYIVASGRCGWLYVGMTNDLIRRIGEHRHGQIDGYSRDHGTDRLVWYEPHRYVDQAILREKRIKRWRRPWKFALIEAANPDWADLYPALAFVPGVDAGSR
ncbi:MAG: GIY-YIG nuclease family protein [Alphaproteobacteria bacterium]|nr:GIY-YIG nuclease family protein [Alphaproteobacteria bacterium]